MSALHSGLRRLALAVAVGMAVSSPAYAEIRGLEFVAVSGVGSGLDQTARALQATLEKEKLASRIQVETKPGASGTVGLAYFVTTKKGRGDSILVASFAQMVAVDLNKSPVGFDQVKPLARIAGEYVVVAVRKESPIQSLDDLVAKFKADPTSVSWGGGSIGSADHVLVGMLAKAAGVPAGKINFISHAGGGEATAAILGGHVTAGVSTFGELASYIKSGQMRVLGIAAPAAVDGIDAPTMKSLGYDVQLISWRGLFVPKDIPDADFKALGDAIGIVVASPAWKTLLTERNWLNQYLPSDEFAAFFAQDQQQVRETLRSIELLK